MATVRLLWDLGLDDMRDMARAMGVAPEKPLTYVSALGAVEVTPIQMALAYASFANGGRRLQPRWVTEVRDRDGKVLASPPRDPGVAALDPVAAAQMASILRGVVERGTARRAFEGFAQPFAGKTGTTNSARDAWFVGFSPEVAVAVWIGRDDNKALADDAGGGKVAAPIVRDFLDRSRMRTTEVPVPPDAFLASSDPDTGLPSAGRTAVREIVRTRPDAPQPEPRQARGAAERRPVRPPPRRVAEPEPADYEADAPASPPTSTEYLR